jgi:hypothetical protein
MRLPVLLIGALALLFAGVMSTAAHAQSVEEHDAKAAFMLKLVNFVQWPADAGGRELVVGFIGSDATGDALQRLASGKLVNGHGIVVRRLKHDGDLKSCQVIFVGAGEAKNIPAILQSLHGTSVLTVGETDGFGRRGGIVNLLLSEGRIHFEVNSHAAERARLQISSRLLSLATIVADGN